MWPPPTRGGRSSWTLGCSSRLPSPRPHRPPPLSSSWGTQVAPRVSQVRPACPRGPPGASPLRVSRALASQVAVGRGRPSGAPAPRARSSRLRPRRPTGVPVPPFTPAPRPIPAGPSPPSLLPSGPVCPLGPSRKQAPVKQSDRGRFAELWAGLGRPPGQGWKPRLSQLQSQEGLGEGAPLNQTGGWSWERGTASCAPQQGRDLTRLPVDCLQGTLVCPPGSRGRREPRSGFSDRLAPQDTGGEPGRGCSRKVGPQHRPWSVLCRGRGWGPGVRGRGTRACIGAVALGSPLPSLLPPLCIGENHQTSCSVGREEACEAFRRSPTHQKVLESGRQSQPAPRRAPDQPRAACGSWGRLLDRSPSLR